MKVLHILHNILITLFLAITLPIIGFCVLLSKLICFDRFCSFKELGLTWLSTLIDIWKRVDSCG